LSIVEILKSLSRKRRENEMGDTGFAPKDLDEANIAVRNLSDMALEKEYENYKSLAISVMRSDESTVQDDVYYLFHQIRRLLEAEFIRRKRIHAMQFKDFDKECSIVYFDIKGFVPISEELAIACQRNPDDVRIMLRRKVDFLINELLLYHSPLSLREVGGDGWHLTFPNANSAARWSQDLMRGMGNEFVSICVGMAWGIPRLTVGGATDRASITAFELVDTVGKHIMMDPILMTKEIKTRIKDALLKRLCQFVGICKLGSLGSMPVYQMTILGDEMK
jgi:hypothetical protein